MVERLAVSRADVGNASRQFKLRLRIDEECFTSGREITLRRAGSIPTQMSESTLGSSWNATIPGSWLAQRTVPSYR